MTETRHYRRNSTVGPIEAKVLNEFDYIALACLAPILRAARGGAS